MQECFEGYLAKIANFKPQIFWMSIGEKLDDYKYLLHNAKIKGWVPKSKYLVKSAY